MATLLANRAAGALLDRYLARTGYDAQQTDQQVPPGRPDNLWLPLDGEDGHDFGAHVVFGDRAHERAPQQWVIRHARLLLGGLTTAGALAATLPRCGRTSLRRNDL
ncbi:hypothetical protein [Streptomyces sp. S186]|uniref:hypothetical protein n=1 Tax=Streptomyces sp. S186 TaxID=3434395 RepID=UPI003F671694